MYEVQYNIVGAGCTRRSNRSSISQKGDDHAGCSKAKVMRVSANVGCRKGPNHLARLSLLLVSSIDGQTSWLLLLALPPTTQTHARTHMHSRKNAYTNARNIFTCMQAHMCKSHTILSHSHKHTHKHTHTHAHALSHAITRTHTLTCTLRISAQ